MTFVRNMGGKVGDEDVGDEGELKVRASEKRRASGSYAFSQWQRDIPRKVMSFKTRGDDEL